MVKIGVVVPTIREQHLLKFLDSWKEEFEKWKITLYIVEDNTKKSFSIPEQSYEVKHFCHKDIDKDLKEVSWIIPRKTSAIRSYGYYKAWQDGNAFIITLDDDCYKEVDDFILNHIVDVKLKDWAPFYDVGAQFYPVSNIHMRGYPFSYRAGKSPVISVGGWSYNPDLDAVTQLSRGDPKLWVQPGKCAVPRGLGVTMCGMNIAFTREVIPAAYFLLQGRDWGVDRWDDIWAGYFMKKIFDHLDKVFMINGDATVFHDRASNPYKNLYPEGVGYGSNELLWEKLQTIQLTKDNYVDCYVELAKKMKSEWFPTVEYGDSLRAAMIAWAGLFKDGL